MALIAESERQKNMCFLWKKEKKKKIIDYFLAIENMLTRKKLIWHYLSICGSTLSCYQKPKCNLNRSLTAKIWWYKLYWSKFNHKAISMAVKTCNNKEKILGKQEKHSYREIVKESWILQKCCFFFSHFTKVFLTWINKWQWNFKSIIFELMFQSLP